MHDALRWFLVLCVFAHGIGHVLFMPLLFGPMRLQATGHSWLLSPAVGDGPVRLAASAIGAIALALFLAVAGGMVIQAAWWRPLALVGAALSAGLVVAMWDGVQAGPAVGALAFDLAIIVGLAVVRWPGPEVLGS